MAFNVNKHILVPTHSKVSEAEKKKVLETYKVGIFSLPKINKSDPAIGKLDVKMGDIVKVERVSKTAGMTSYYRVVING